MVTAPSLLAPGAVRPSADPATRTATAAPSALRCTRRDDGTADATRRPPTSQFPGLAPDVRGADVGLAPENPSLMPIPEVRISESESAAYTRLSTEDEIRRR